MNLEPADWFVAAGDTFLVHASDLDQPGMADAFNAMVEAKWSRLWRPASA